MMDLGVARCEAELDAVVGQNGMDLIGNGGYQSDEEAGSGDPRCLIDKSDEGELAGAIDRNKR